MNKHTVLALDSIIRRIKRFNSSPVARLHPVAKDYLNVSLVDVELWQETDPQPLQRHEFHDLILNNVFSIWCDMSPFNWSNAILHNHAENTADKLTAIIYGG